MKLFIAALLIPLLAIAGIGVQKATQIKHAPTAPLTPDTGSEAASSSVSIATSTWVAQTPDYPTQLTIPSIGLNDAVVGVGTTSNGEMDVPDGVTGNVGWYKFGTLPGHVGSAVVDAHVFAAFSKLKDLTVGSSIYVETSGGDTLHFVVSDIETYALADVPAGVLFNRADTQRLNLITCAGKLTPDGSTYDHRLVVYATLVNDSA